MTVFNDRNVATARLKNKRHEGEWQSPELLPRLSEFESPVTHYERNNFNQGVFHLPFVAPTKRSRC